MPAMTKSTTSSPGDAAVHLAYQSQRRWQFVAMFGLAVVMYAFYVIDHAAESDASSSGGSLKGHLTIKSNRVKRNDAADGVCYTICDAYRTAVGEDVNVTESLSQAVDAKLKELHGQYGKDNFERIFKKADRKASADPRFEYATFTTAHIGGGHSIELAAKKMLVKVVEAQINRSERSKDVEGCDCSNGKAKAVGNVPQDASIATIPTSTTFSKFVWATGGHSAAAGHGNLFNETNTVWLEKMIAPIFNSVGVSFEARNYGMGGTPSGPEIGMCTRSVFGDDVDAMSWDYGMTDGDRLYRMLMYMYRASMHRISQPIFVGMHLFGNYEKQRIDQFRSMEDLGVPTFVENDQEFKDMVKGIPDTQGLNQEQIDAMPPLVKNFKCFGKIEKGEPFCEAEKYNMAVCPGRRARASWHPGVKHQAMDGNRIGLLLMTLLQTAVASPRFQEATDLEALLQELRDEEKSQREAFAAAELPEQFRTLNFEGMTPEITDEMMEIMFRGDNICHTARLPAQIRFKGILTETPDKLGEQAAYGKETYDVGIEEGVAKKSGATDGKMRLVYDRNGEREVDCPVAVKVDYKDWFYVNHLDGQVSLTIPNKMERKEYGYDPEMVKGLIVACKVICDWGNCPDGDVTLEDFNKDKSMSMQVNSQPVTSVLPLEANCAILSHAGGVYFDKNADGVFEIQVKMLQEKSYLRLSGVVVY